MVPTIYLKVDGSDLLCEKSLDWTRHTMREARKIFRQTRDFQERYKPLHQMENNIPIGKLGDWDPVITTLERPDKKPIDFIFALGRVARHEDSTHPKHTLLWILRDSDALVLPSRRHEPQTVGTILAFNCHREHSLRYRNNSSGYVRIWAAYMKDSKIPWTEENARSTILSDLEASC